MSQERTVRLLLTALLALTCLLMTWRYAIVRLYPDDDLLWLIQSASTLFRATPDMHEHYEIYRAYLTSSNADSLWFIRADTREQLADSQNYLFSMLWLHATQYLVNVISEGSFNERLATIFLIGFPTQTLFICSITILIFTRARAENALVILAIAIAMLIGADLVGDLAGRGANPALIIQSQLANPIRFVGNLLQTLFDPTPAFTPFYPPPKNQAQWVLLLAVWLRWNRQSTWSYFTLLAGAAFHQDYMGLFLIAFVAIDLFARPLSLRRAALLPIAAGLALYFARGSLLWSAVGGGSSAMAIAICLGLLLVFAGAWLVGRMFPKVQSIGTSRSRIVAVDLVLIAIGWSLTLILLIPVNVLVDPVSSSLFWGNVHGRLYGMLHPALILGLSILLVDRLVLKGGQNRLPGLTLGALSIAALTAALAYSPSVLTPSQLHDNISERLAELSDARLSDTGPSGRAEAIFYYHAVKALSSD